MPSEVRVRFAPSPTGYLHVGGARTALFNYLFARHNGGKFILRIEDTDRSRFQEGALDEIFTSLQWLKLHWDEGPDAGGDYGPYYQSERTELYEKYTEELLEGRYAYRCFCTPERLKKLREEQEKEKVGHVSGYDKHCRDIPKEKVQHLLDEGNEFVVRLRVPENRTVTFTDLIRGNIDYRSDVLDDIVLLKSDGYPTYHLANVVDDHLMHISHVLRGDEWITSTPRHILIYEAFGWEPPKFAHLPVILAHGGGKLSKRKGAASVMDYKKRGYLPEALINFLVLLGWAPGDDREKMPVDEIIEAFSLEKVSPKASVFDEQKLEWMNGLYMQEAGIDTVINDVVRLWKEMKFIKDNANEDDPYLQKVIALLKDRSKTVLELSENANYFFTDPDTYDEKTVKKRWKGDAVTVMQILTERMERLEDFSQNSLEALYRDYADETGLSGGKLIHPTRLAVSGVNFGPGLFELLEVLGKETVVRRMKAAVTWLQKREE
jgi:glutamyl-tRNA synthetase